MNPANFIPTLFVGIGETNALYTLRESYLHASHSAEGVRYEVRSFHHRNLSQDADTAIEKAEEFAAKMGYKMTSTAESLKAEMRDINRATAEQMAERRRRQQVQEELWAVERAEREAADKELATQGMLPFGPYRSKKFIDAPLGYVNWLMEKVEEFDAGSLLRFVADEVIKQCPEMRLPKPLIDVYVGYEGKRDTFKVNVIRSYSFLKEGYGWNAPLERHFITTMVTDSGACLVCFSGSFCPDVGEVLTIKATVKKHEEYKGQAQTIVQRVKEIEAK